MVSVYSTGVGTSLEETVAVLLEMLGAVEVDGVTELEEVIALLVLALVEALVLRLEVDALVLELV